MDYSTLKKDLSNWIEKKVKDAGAKGVVFGLSGGIDSAVIAYLTKEIFNENALGIIMPIDSNEQDEQDAIKIIEDLNLNYKRVDLNDTYNILLDATNEDVSKEAAANIKPRLRMMSLYYFAQKNNYLVIGSSNKSEFLTGYFTKYGDSGSDIMPLADLLKIHIYGLAKELKVLDIIINKKPSAGLREGQTDEDDFGFTYEELDNYLENLSGKEETVNKIKKLINKSNHKRSFAEMFKLF